MPTTKTLPQRLLECDAVPTGPAAAIASHAGIDVLAEADRIPAYWTPEHTADQVTASRARDARILASLRMHDDHVTAVAAAETRVSVLKSLAANRGISPTARVDALLALVRVDPELTGVSFGLTLNRDRLAAAVLADPAAAPLAQPCIGAIIDQLVDTDASGLALAAWATATLPETHRTIRNVVHHGWADGCRLQLSDDAVEQLFDSDAPHELTRRDACRIAWSDPDLDAAAMLDLIDAVSDRALLVAWATGKTPSRPRPGDLSAAVADQPSRSSRLDPFAKELQPGGPLAGLPWADELAGCLSVGSFVSGYGVPEPLAARMRTRLGDDPVAWLAACELSELMVTDTVDQLCDAALGLAG